MEARLYNGVLTITAVASTRPKVVENNYVYTQSVKGTLMLLRSLKGWATLVHTIVLQAPSRHILPDVPSSTLVGECWELVKHYKHFLRHVIIHAGFFRNETELDCFTQFIFGGFYLRSLESFSQYDVNDTMSTYWVERSSQYADDIVNIDRFHP